MTDRVQKIKDWISKEQDGLMDAQGNFAYREDEGAYHILCALDAYIDSLQEEPVSEDLEKIVGEIAEPTILNAYGTKELARRLHNTICGTSVSKDLKKAADEYADGENPTCPCEECLIKTFKAGAEWQKKQDQSTIELAEDHAMLAGMNKMEQQMMAKAIEVTVHMDADNYPYIAQLELYDYDNDIPLAKEGDMYKVVLIKEDEL